MRVSKAKAVKLAKLAFEGYTIKRAAQEIGIGETHAYRMTSSPEFCETLAELKRRAIDDALTDLSRNAKTAVSALMGLIVDLETPPQVVCTAAGKILDGCVKLAQFTDQEERLTRIEELLAQQESEKNSRF